MPTNRETTALEVGGHIFTAKTYATAREASTIQQAYFKGTKVEMIGDQPKINEFNPNVQYEVQLELIRQMVVSMDDSSNDIVGRCEDLPNEVFQDLVDQLDAMVAKKKS
jgi:hypothetical protein